jgi:hypothetical protein
VGDQVHGLAGNPSQLGLSRLHDIHQAGFVVVELPTGVLDDGLRPFTHQTTSMVGKVGKGSAFNPAIPLPMAVVKSKVFPFFKNTFCVAYYFNYQPTSLFTIDICFIKSFIAWYASDSSGKNME